MPAHDASSRKSSSPTRPGGGTILHYPGPARNKDSRWSSSSPVTAAGAVGPGVAGEVGCSPSRLSRTRYWLATKSGPEQLSAAPGGRARAHHHRSWLRRPRRPGGRVLLPQGSANDFAKGCKTGHGEAGDEVFNPLSRHQHQGRRPDRGRSQGRRQRPRPGVRHRVPQVQRPGQRRDVQPRTRSTTRSPSPISSG